MSLSRANRVPADSARSNYNFTSRSPRVDGPDDQSDSDAREHAHGSLADLPKQRNRRNSRGLPYSPNPNTPHSRTASIDKNASSASLHRRSSSTAWMQLQSQPQLNTQHSPQLSQAFSPETRTPHMVDVPLEIPSRHGISAFYERNKGLAYVLSAQVFGVLMNVTTRLLEVEGNQGAGMHPFQILFVRMAITTSLSVAYMYYSKTPHFPFGLREVRWLLMMRGIGGFFGVFGMYYSLMYLPLADATVITFIAPIISCWACSFLLKEPFTRMEQVGAFVSFSGVMLIARPTTFFHGSVQGASGGEASIDGQIGTTVDTRSLSDMMSIVTRSIVERAAHDYNDVTSAQRFGAVCVALTGVVGQAGAFTAMRWIGKRAHPLLSVTYFCAWCTIVSATAMVILPNVKFLLPSDTKEWSYLIFLGICGFLMQFLLSAGLQHEKSSRATNMVYTQMLFALFFDKLVFGTNPTLLSLLGSSFILGSAIYVAVRKESMKQKQEAAKAARTEAESSGLDLEMQQRARGRNSSINEEQRGLVEGIDLNDDDKLTEQHQKENGQMKSVG